MAYKLYPDAITILDGNVKIPAIANAPTDKIDDHAVSTTKMWSGRKIKKAIRDKQLVTVVDELPDAPEEGVIYLTHGENGFVANIFDGDWKHLNEIGGVNSGIELVVTTDSGATVTVTGYGKEISGVVENGTVTLPIPFFGTWNVVGEKDGMTSETQVVVDEVKRYEVELSFIPPASAILNENSWAVISAYSLSGLADSLWNVGDYKEITLSGTCLDQSLSGTYRVFILGFDHNKDLETDGLPSIHFGCFKTTTGQDIAIGNSKTYPYITSSYSGLSTTTYFNMCGNNTTNGSSSTGTNYLGWENTFMRHTILGSTNKSWDSVKNSTSADFNAPSDSATNPASKTLMSCLPSDLRAVIRPVKKWTDNIGRATDTASNVTQIVDYLPLLAEYEVQGDIYYANSSEQSKQAQYAYYVAGNTKIKQLQNKSSSAYWWLRSPYSSSSIYFCFVSDNGGANNTGANRSYGVAPLFVV